MSLLRFIHDIRKYIDIMIYYEVVFSTRLVSLGNFKSLEFRAETGENDVRLATPHKAP